ncbi:MAG: Na+/H+ antiporter subunit E [Candidatus Delongbacteria bacterium]|jgi:multicomponent Na+:H+ antiporter subunit E|nr:Na+/H+ antiporter subunit E [Candidatus Delongbacteria bacterium]
MDKMLRIMFSTIMFTLFYFIWTGTKDLNNLLIMFALSLVVSIIFRNHLRSPLLNPKKIAYSIWYVLFLFIEIIKANLDVALRVIKPVIPINPGIVTVKTKLKTAMGRMILANSITLTPGTLTVDIDGDTLYIHWIDVTNMDEKAATEKIVSNFEKYLEVIFD